MIMKRWGIVLWLSIVLSLIAVIPAFTAYAQNIAEKFPLSRGSLQQINEYFSSQTTTYNDGTTLNQSIINGPPKPPPGYELERTTISLPEPRSEMGSNTLIVPAFNWVFGCSAVSGAMIAGYHDRSGFPNIYTGPTNGGTIPLQEHSSWTNWIDSYGDTYPNNPLIASHDGLDGRVGRGSIDDYWVGYGSSPDPYITGGWTQHTWGDAIGDYMKTSQSAYGNTDGSTQFWGYTSSAAPLTCSAMESYSIDDLDGTYGRKLFYEARGYTVTVCYNQNTDNDYSGGFSFAQYMDEIDAGRPVLLNLEGHSIVGVGYDDSSNTVYIHDTWDNSNHTMTWGGSYAGMRLLSVSIVQIGDNPSPPTVTIVATDATATEAGPTTGAFTISRTGSTAAALTVYYTVGGTSTTGSDRNSLPEVLTIPAGASSAPIVITPVNDTLCEGDETVIITLKANAAYTVGTRSAATITITDNDCSTTVTIVA
ncbi:MAG: C39 family peptidase, partial [Syntrophales bacterium]|nr:C39 family peptidase [Syntrophales bacterium]